MHFYFYFDAFLFFFDAYALKMVIFHSYVSLPEGTSFEDYGFVNSILKQPENPRGCTFKSVDACYQRSDRWPDIAQQIPSRFPGH